MPCDAAILKNVPLFALLDDEERAVLASQVEVRTFAVRQRVYKIGDPSGEAFILVSGSVRVTTVDEDSQEVVLDEPAVGEFFGFASMLDRTPHQTEALALTESVCIEVDRHDISVSAGAQAACGHGHAGGVRAAIPRGAEAGASALAAQPE